MRQDFDPLSSCISMRVKLEYESQELMGLFISFYQIQKSAD